jgi:hypothetical protein
VGGLEFVHVWALWVLELPHGSLLSWAHLGFLPRLLACVDPLSSRLSSFSVTFVGYLPSCPQPSAHHLAHGVHIQHNDVIISPQVRLYQRHRVQTDYLQLMADEMPGVTSVKEVRPVIV